MRKSGPISSFKFTSNLKRSS